MHGHRHLLYCGIVGILGGVRENQKCEVKSGAEETAENIIDI